MDRISRCGPGQGGGYDPATYRVVFCSSAPIGVPFLEALWHDDRYDVVGVLTMPDMPSGRWLQMQENIIKTKAKELMHNAEWIMHNNKYAVKPIPKIILVHGKDTDPSQKRYPHFIDDIKDAWINAFAPHLPHSSDPLLPEWLGELGNLNIDEDTILVWHSLGGVAILRYLEKTQQKVKKVILVATNDSIYSESSNGFFSDKDYDYTLLQSVCHDYVVYHSTDDERVPFLHGEKIAKWLNAKFFTYHDKWHFGKSLIDNKFPELIDEVLINTTFIQTTHSLRLDSKKYAHEAAETYDRLQALDIDYLVVIAYGHIIPQHILDIPRIAPINIHGSPLPLYRGASPIQTALLDGQEETGITIMRMVAELDAGDMIRSYRFPLPLSWTARDVIDKMQSVWPHFLTETLDGLSHGEYGYTPQESDKATFCGKIEKEDGELSLLHENLMHIYNKYRAYYLWPKIYFRMYHTQTEEKKRVIIEDMQLDEWLYLLHSHKPLCDRHYMLNCTLVSCSVKVEGKKAITRAERVATYTKNNRSML